MTSDVAMVTPEATSRTPYVVRDALAMTDCGRIRGASGVDGSSIVKAALVGFDDPADLLAGVSRRLADVPLGHAVSGGMPNGNRQFLAQDLGPRLGVPVSLRELLQ